MVNGRRTAHHLLALVGAFVGGAATWQIFWLQEPEHIPVGAAFVATAQPARERQPAPVPQPPLSTPTAVAAAQEAGSQTSELPPEAEGYISPEAIEAEAEARAARITRLAEGEPPPANVVLHAVTTKGIQEAISEHLSGFAACFEPWSELQPGLRGDLKVDIEIVRGSNGRFGRVGSVGIRNSTMHNLALEGCLGSVVAEAAFEPPDESIRVTVPIAMTSGPEAGPPDDAK